MKSFETQKDRKLILSLPSKSVKSVSTYGFYYFYSIPKPSSASTTSHYNHKGSGTRIPEPFHLFFKLFLTNLRSSSYRNKLEHLE